MNIRVSARGALVLAMRMDPTPRTACAISPEPSGQPENTSTCPRYSRIKPKEPLSHDQKCERYLTVPGSEACPVNGGATTG